ncbi:MULTISPECIES: WbqC family protein [unclassified Halomonas]|uniref:WbqC family protein n=1 Tax=unclassified Halomonas TaxID=2609666 RepID=UPI0007D98373|nr:MULTISPECIES: WbqC family protein [unclassified Halomonas]MBT2785998.1 WbqC family protein [Halomonas sp. ISL-106]MBT2797020.1 WbqC family protein [Halomonas sp. ISL-104]OAL58407.1 hypothetical protein A6R74_05805 [Halomonas sp. ALS9]
MSSIAIMQPYFFPYGGYFSLASASDTFVFFDDVNFIKKGWINRNKLCNDINIVVPLRKASINKKINEIEIINEKNWRTKLLNSLNHCYHKAPYFDNIYSLVECVIEPQYKSIADMARESIVRSSEYLSLNCHWEVSSTHYPETATQKGAQRLQAITKGNRCSHYYNPIGGIELYSKEDFLKRGIHLEFISNNSMGKISILDYMMRHPPDTIKKLINEYNIS